MKRKTDKLIVIGVCVITLFAIFMKVPESKDLALLVVGGLLGITNSK